MHPIQKLSRAAVLAGALLTVPVVAQDAPATPQTLAFPGGSLSQFVEALRADSASRGTPVNIVVPDTAKSVAVPALELTGASVSDALRAVGTILAPTVRINVETYEDDMAVHAIQVFPLTPKEAPPPPKTLGVFSLSGLIPNDFFVDDGLSVSSETALTAIETALDIDGGPEPEIRFHADSRLLFVRATTGQTQIVSNVIRQLEQDLEALHQRARAARGSRPAAPPERAQEATRPDDPTAPPVRRR